MNQETAFGILKTGRNVFLTGSAGTGKTYLLNRYIRYLEERDIRPTITAPTGIAASHIGGMTIHSFFGIGIREDINDYILEFMLQKEYLYRRLSAVKVLVIDEISMVSPELFRTIDKILRAFKQSAQPFGGVQIILSGDFFQLPPISKTACELKFAWQTEEWRKANLRVCYLEEKFRQSEEALICILDEIRSGAVSESSMEIFRSCYKKELPGSFKAAKLYTHNEDVDRINNEELKALAGEMKVFCSINKGAKKYIERILNSSLVIEELKLKKGALVIFIKNNYEAGYINGTLGKVIGFSKTTGAPIVEIFSGEKIAAEPEDWKYENEKGDLKAVVRQTPLRLAWALTVHKSQGMTLDAAEIDLSRTFEAGQGYVALSRIRSIAGLRLMGLNDIALRVDQSVLKIDKEMKKLSSLIALKFASFSEEEKEAMNQKFIKASGGLVDAKKIAEQKKRLKEEKNVVEKESTLAITERLLLEKKTVAEIAAERGLSETTIMGHIEKLACLKPDFDLSHLRPEEKILKRIAEAVKAMKARNSADDFLEGGRLRMKAVFEILNEEVGYEEIRLGLVFIK